MNIAYLSLGSNLGDREENLKKAVDRLDKAEGIVVKKVSPLYETQPVGYVEQGMFLNIAVEIETNLDPYGLLKCIDFIEHDLKRERTIRWGPRTIDIDILIYGDIKINDDLLQIPHPRMWERAFVLIPLCDVNPHIKKGNQYISELIKNLPDKDGVKLYKCKWYQGMI